MYMYIYMYMYIQCIENIQHSSKKEREIVKEETKQYVHIHVHVYMYLFDFKVNGEVERKKVHRFKVLEQVVIQLLIEALI